MVHVGSRRGAVNSSVILAILAVLSIGGLIYWLEVTAVPTQTDVVIPDDARDEPPLLDVPIVEIESMRSEPEGYVGLEVAIRNSPVNSFLGERGVWIGPEENPFLAMLDSAAAAAGPELARDDWVHVRGHIRAMSDSVLDAWEETGVIGGAGDRAVAAFAEYFLQTSEVERAPAPPGTGEMQDSAVTSDTVGATESGAQGDG